MRVQSGLGDQEFAEAYVARLNELWSQGVKRDTKMLDKAVILKTRGYNFDTASRMLAQDGVFKMFIAMFGENWTNNDNVVTHFYKALEARANVIGLTQGSIWGHEPYNMNDGDPNANPRWSEYSAALRLENVAPVWGDEAGRSVEITLSTVNNAAMSHYPGWREVRNDSVGYEKATYTITSESDDKYETLTDVELHS